MRHQQANKSFENLPPSVSHVNRGLFKNSIKKKIEAVELNVTEKIEAFELKCNRNIKKITGDGQLWVASKSKSWPQHRRAFINRKYLICNRKEH